MDIFQDFLEGFKQHREIMYMQNQENIHLTAFTLCDFAEFIRKENYEEKEV